MGDNDFPAVMGNQPIGFLQQFMQKKGMYSQKGDNVPAFTNTMDVSQQQGGPLVAHGSHSPTFIMDGIPRYTDSGSHDPKDHNAPVDPSGNPIEELRPKDKDIPLAKAKKMLKGFIA
mgnify:CR=1 FL=1|tara:strand:- start:581 stop:931 length:351 start_codon:yes stop_codon:yes gene_type:complete